MAGPLFPLKTTTSTSITEAPFFEGLTTSSTTTSSSLTSFKTKTSFESSVVTPSGSFNLSIQKEGSTTSATTFKDIFSILNFKDIFTDESLKETTESSNSSRNSTETNAESTFDSDSSTMFRPIKVESKHQGASPNPNRFPIHDIISERAVKYFKGANSTTESQTSTTTTTLETSSVFPDDPKSEESFSNVVRKLSSDVEGIKHQMEYGG
jgi:hypothetical protein